MQSLISDLFIFSEMFLSLRTLAESQYNKYPLLRNHYKKLAGLKSEITNTPSQ